MRDIHNFIMNFPHRRRSFASGETPVVFTLPFLFYVDKTYVDATDVLTISFTLFCPVSPSLLFGAAYPPFWESPMALEYLVSLVHRRIYTEWTPGFGVFSLVRERLVDTLRHWAGAQHGSGVELFACDFMATLLRGKED